MPVLIDLRSNQTQWQVETWQVSLVECREQLERVRLIFVVIDGERRLVLRDQPPVFFHGRD